jgi:hypothetical protein
LTATPSERLAAVEELIEVCNDAQHGYAVPVSYLRIALGGQRAAVDPPADHIALFDGPTP